MAVELTTCERQKAGVEYGIVFVQDQGEERSNNAEVNGESMQLGSRIIAQPVSKHKPQIATPIPISCLQKMATTAMMIFRMV